MKSFKTLLKQINESGELSVGGLAAREPQTGSRSAVKDHGKGLFDLDSEGNIRRINAFLESYFSKDCLDLPQSIAMLRAKLNIIGLGSHGHIPESENRANSVLGFSWPGALAQGLSMRVKGSGPGWSRACR